jgi:hypothetical protein
MSTRDSKEEEERIKRIKRTELKKLNGSPSGEVCPIELILQDSDST